MSRKFDLNFRYNFVIRVPPLSLIPPPPPPPTIGMLRHHYTSISGYWFLAQFLAGNIVNMCCVAPYTYNYLYQPDVSITRPKPPVPPSDDW